MICEVEAIRDGWKAEHVCWREEEKNRGLFGARTDASAHAADTAAGKAITVIQTGLWETLGVSVAPPTPPAPPSPPAGSARPDKCTDTADISCVCSKLQNHVPFFLHMCGKYHYFSFFFPGTAEEDDKVSGVSLVPR